MNKYLLILLIAFTIQGICGNPVKLNNYQLSEEQAKRLKEVGNEWRAAVNSERNPCEDFGNFVCSNKTRPQPSYNRDTLDKILKSKSLTEGEKKYIKFSTVCRDIKLEEEYEFIKSFKFDYIGTWPAFDDNWDETKFNLSLAIAELGAYGYNVIFKQTLSVENNDFASLFEISQTKLIDIESEKDVFMTKLQHLEVKHPEEVVADAILFTKVYSESRESLESTSDLEIEFSELKNYFPEVDWNKYVEVKYGESVPNDYPVKVKTHESLKKIYIAISRLSPRVIVNYFFCAYLKDFGVKGAENADLYFLPVIKGTLVEYAFNKNILKMYQDMYTITIKVLEKVFPEFKSDISEELIRFINEELFIKDDLSEDYNVVTGNKEDCVKDSFYLQKYIMKRLMKPYIRNENSLAIIRKSDLTDIFIFMSQSIEPSPFLFEPVALTVLPSVIRHFYRNDTLKNPQRKCIIQQFANLNDVADRDIQMMLLGELLVKGYSEWVKNHPDVIEEENKILKEDGLTSEKLLFISFLKYICQNNRDLEVFETVLRNTEEFPEIFGCPTESKMNSKNKCNLW